ncbi:protein kinase STUNTED-like [Typha angustifolia]|uniref:protein kinase STUNTED-like n=1 Tax=Typha angustifolia TaxID=59011 RepID=UPI003C300195
MKGIGKTKKTKRIVKTKKNSAVASENGIRIENKNTERTKTVLVGMKPNAASRELLTWALVNVAKPGDRVIATHVVRSSSFSCCTAPDSSRKVADTLQTVLSVHSRFCNLKQIDLKLKICRGSSVPKALVQQVISSNAGKIILGVSKSHYLLRSSPSAIARYCAKKLPRDCSVLAMNNGRIAFKRDVNADPRVLAADRNVDCDVDSNNGAGNELQSIIEKHSSSCTVFGFTQLAHMTSNFSSAIYNSESIEHPILFLDNFAEMMIGKGGSGIVYKGQLPNGGGGGEALAIKILKPSADTVKEFISEIEIVSSLRNKNIVSLIGFCYELDCLALVYEYLPNGSLEETLHRAREGKSCFSWARRYKAAVGIARGITYMHGNGNGNGNDNNQPVIHRDIKSANILLSEDFETKLADFGLSLWESAAATYDTCSDIVSGTFGYVAPEYFTYGKVDKKIDVYAFGVVLLELISGRKPISSGCSKPNESIVTWAYSIFHSGKVAELIDPCLRTKYNEDQFERMTLAASLCIRRAPTSRPHMPLILKLLEGDSDTLTWARSRVHTEELVITQEEEEEEEEEGEKELPSYVNLLAMLDIDDDSLSLAFLEKSNSSEIFLFFFKNRFLFSFC